MSPELDRAVELLDRSLAYTRVALVDVRRTDLARPTPCTRWSLDGLLGHMEDALDAFTEAASGLVDVPADARCGPLGGAGARVHRLQVKACALLSAWSGAPPERVTVRDTALAGSLLVGTAALEVTVHGWDVGRATGRGGPIPVSLADGLLQLAPVLVSDDDRGSRFGPPVPTPPGAPADVRLLAFLGRDPSGPAGSFRTVPVPRQRRDP